MPKVSDAHRDARRQQIATAAIACLRRKGLSSTTMADIIAESGLSAGAIYSNFTNKAELAGYIARTVVDGRATQVAAITGPDGGAASPIDVAVGATTILTARNVPFDVVLQVWAESTVDTSMRDVVLETIDLLRTAFSTAVRPWVTARYPTEATDAACARLARTILTLCQGYIVSTAVLGPRDPREYFDEIAFVFAPDQLG